MVLRVGRTRWVLRILILTVLASLPWRGIMAFPVLAYLGVQRIVVVCQVDPAETGALTVAAIGEQARLVVSGGLAQARSPLPVVLASTADEAIIDPAALLVLIQANAMADPTRSGQAALAVALRRPGQPSEALPLFPAAPVTLDLNAATLESGLQRALRSLLLPTVVEPLLSMPGAR
ncbi:hypothetical protein D2T81_27850 [Azospirillum brasilense]|nr:hypothetical protein D2T81_27850 [Azospirillum brasilense]